MNRSGTIVVLAALVAACASEPEQQPAAASTPVASSVTSRAPERATPATAPATRPPAAPERAATDPFKDPSSLLSKRTVFYDYDESTVKASDRPVIEAHGAWLKAHPGASLEVEGNCDERGSREYNLALGQRRADAVKKMLVLVGASERQIETVSYGEEHPHAQGHDESAWAQNRRSDLVYRRTQ